MPRVKKPQLPTTTADAIFDAVDKTVLYNAIAVILKQGGAIMLGQTRDNAKLIATVYLDGEQDKEYCDDARDVEQFIGQYQI